MTTRSKLWLAIASVFNVMNLSGAVYAIMHGEALHAAVHLALLPPGAYWTMRLVRRGRLRPAASALPTDLRLEQLQQSVDAIAVEVERIGEAQRFTAKLQHERDAQR